MNDKDIRYQRRRKWFGALSLILFAIVIILLTLFITKIRAPYLRSTE